MKKNSKITIANTSLVFVFLLAFFVLAPSMADAAYTYGNSGTGMLQSNYFQGLTIGPLEQYVYGATNYLNVWVRNNENYSKVLSIRKGVCRCQEAQGYPYRSGIGQCQYYWSPDAANKRPGCQTVSQNITVRAQSSVMLQGVVSQYKNQSCGSFQLDFFIDKINGAAPRVAYPYAGPWAASFANLVRNCSAPATCTSHASQRCVGNAVYWFDSCGKQQELSKTCAAGQTCQNAQCINITCSTNSQCGTNGFTGGPYCQGNGVYRNYTSYTCNNPGTTSSSCTSQTTAQLQNTCQSNQTCSNGTCGNVTCNTNTDCGTNQYTGSNFCQGNAVYKNYVTYTCNNPGTTSSSCTSQTTAQLQNTCSANQTCSNGTCVDQQAQCTSHASQRCVGNSIYWFDSCGNQQELSQACTANQTCSNNTCVNQQQQAFTATVTVRNLTRGTLNWSSSTNASPSEVVQFNVAIQAPSNQPINNVTVRDVFPNNLSYRDALKVDGTANSGDLFVGVNIGSIPMGQTKNVTYEAQVGPTQNFPVGATTLNDAVTVTVTDAGYNQATGSASVIVTKTATSGATTAPTGLTNNVWVDSFFIPLMIGLLGFWLVRSNAFGIAEKIGLNNLRYKGFLAQQQLDSKIQEIKNKEI
ncbi:MAG: hypothetical protein A2730_02790 [Candidatus Staskawiczbacteria bacterium RIFCSPHIGHO2_01_FULL_39_25]|uniref:DUF11 domain-containing protein n=1 Tax=Candidatus Staskawiczbacteria bacterium RIFCSPHIGHO2_01_FULL_39_25 TaxID=1802202 RepID=A0A1G2HQ29_9BACT|nr:MAG: hypothetical protein A2730_02790 [Candidatus Staskawiczbacteria bacterium RIFCSPHIGHO2_01_FULL_39_25]